MKLSDVRKAYEDLSGKASDLVRQMSLAAIALIWVFKSGPQDTPSLDDRLLRAAICVTLALILDFLQYAIGASVWFCFFRIKERAGLQMDAEITAPEWLPWTTWLIFFAKILCVIVAYSVYMLPFFLGKFVSV